MYSARSKRRGGQGGSERRFQFGAYHSYIRAQQPVPARPPRATGLRLTPPATCDKQESTITGLGPLPQIRDLMQIRDAFTPQAKGCPSLSICAPLPHWTARRCHATPPKPDVVPLEAQRKWLLCLSIIRAACCVLNRGSISTRTVNAIPVVAFRVCPVSAVSEAKQISHVTGALPNSHSIPISISAGKPHHPQATSIYDLLLFFRSDDCFMIRLISVSCGTIGSFKDVTVEKNRNLRPEA